MQFLFLVISFLKHSPQLLNRISPGFAVFADSCKNTQNLGKNVNVRSETDIHMRARSSAVAAPEALALAYHYRLYYNGSL